MVCSKSLCNCPTTPSGGFKVTPVLDHWPVTGETGLDAANVADNKQQLTISYEYRPAPDELVIFLRRERRLGDILETTDTDVVLGMYNEQLEAIIVKNASKRVPSAAAV